MTMNYTVEMTTEIVAAYTAEPVKATIEKLAEKYGKSVRSIVAKLSAEKVYKSEVKADAIANKVPTKLELIEKIASDLGVDKEKLASLEKATKEALQILADNVNAA